MFGSTGVVVALILVSFTSVVGYNFMLEDDLQYFHIDYVSP